MIVPWTYSTISPNETHYFSAHISSLVLVVESLSTQWLEPETCTSSSSFPFSSCPISNQAGLIDFTSWVSLEAIYLLHLNCHFLNQTTMLITTPFSSISLIGLAVCHSSHHSLSDDVVLLIRIFQQVHIALQVSPDFLQWLIRPFVIWTLLTSPASSFPPLPVVSLNTWHSIEIELLPVPQMSHAHSRPGPVSTSYLLSWKTALQTPSPSIAISLHPKSLPWSEKLLLDVLCIRSPLHLPYLHICYCNHLLKSSVSLYLPLY